jgi:hypothetical protein
VRSARRLRFPHGIQTDELFFKVQKKFPPKKFFENAILSKDFMMAKPSWWPRGVVEWWSDGMATYAFRLRLDVLKGLLVWLRKKNIGNGKTSLL